MKRKYILLFVAAFLIIISGCGSGSSVTETNEQLDELGHRLETNSSVFANDREIRQSKFMRSAIVEVSKKAGLVPLKEKPIKTDFLELRLWGDLGLAVERVFILERSANNNWAAQMATSQQNYVEKTSDDGSYRITKTDVTVKNYNDLKPKSGWNVVSEYLESNGIYPPLNYSFDLPDDPSMDEGFFILEVKADEKHDFVGYGWFTESADGKKFKEICEFVEDEFDVNMGCKLQTVQ